MNTQKFWLVWSPQGKTAPTCRHFSKDPADKEAERLASLNPGHEFYVLTAESLTMKRTVDVIQLGRNGDGSERRCSDCGIPF